MSRSLQVAAMGPQTGPALFVRQINYPTAVSATYPVTSADYGTALNITGLGTVTVQLPPAATFRPGFWVAVWNTSTSDVSVSVRCVRTTDTIDGVASSAFPGLRRGEGLVLLSDGSNWQTNYKKSMRGYSENLAATSRAIAVGDASVALGFSLSTGTGAFSANNNTNSGINGGYSTYSIAIGNSAVSAAARSIAIGSGANCQDADQVAIGTSASVGSFAVYGAAIFGTSPAEYAFAFGRYASPGVNKGKFAFSSFNSGTAGYQQAGLIVLSATTTGTGTAKMRTNSSTVAGDNQVSLTVSTAVAFSALIVAKQASTSTNCAAWKIEGLVVRDSSSTVTLINSTTTVIDNTPGWTTPTVAADSSNTSLGFTVTAPSGITVQWTASVTTTETRV